jgi:hypothetical protein
VDAGVPVKARDTLGMDEREEYGERVSARLLTSPLQLSMSAAAALSGVVHLDSLRLDR